MSQQEPHPTDSTEEHGADASLVRPGDITYLHIPAADVRRAAAFYRDVFGWTIHGPDSDRPSFNDATGHLSGAWMSDQTPSREPGLLPYIYVEDVAETARQVVAQGGAIVTAPYPEGQLTVATFRDPAGNVFGLWHDDTR
jgi:predicted enzyme related to lactoylglutathione lyase